MGKTAFVTGSTGFLGLNLIETLQEQGWTIYALHRKTSDLTYLKRYNVELVCGDLNDYSSLIEVMPEDLDAVFHTAANTSYWSKHNKQQYQDNVIGTRNIVNCSMAKNAGRFIHTSSISAYGIHSFTINENTPSNVETIKPRINYDVTKYYSELEVREGISKGLDAVIMNPCRIMGPYETRWSEFIKMVYNDQKPPFIPPGIGMLCHVKDLSHAFINAVDHGETGKNYLLGGIEASFLEIVNEVRKIRNQPPYQKVTPKWKLILLSKILTLGSLFTGKQPLITRELVELLSEKITCNYKNAQKTLGYKTSSLQKIITDSLNWLKKEGKL